jgi:hypothetical protein
MGVMDNLYYIISKRHFQHLLTAGPAFPLADKDSMPLAPGSAGKVAGDQQDWLSVD